MKIRVSHVASVRNWAILVGGSLAADYFGGSIAVYGFMAGVVVGAWIIIWQIIEHTKKDDHDR